MNETTESFLRIEAIFHEAQAAQAEARRDLIESRCAGDQEMASEVWSLLEACAAEERVTASRHAEPETGRENQPALKRVGPYEIERLLGRGGMGAVYLAHRADGQFEQTVAIKLIDLPLATEIFRERFRQERQILAELQHPFIARLLDGGVAAGGDPYLVMEYVDGAPIQRFCEEKPLAESQRIALFLRVCEAVQFAHQNFVVHRDLKPDNILVTEDGTPRLLDFGTAKLLSPSLAGPGVELTREGYQSFTPQYASPEQVLGNAITTATDTYSLGVLLYVLLTGTQPYELKELTTGEMLRVICEEAPRKPTHAAGSEKRLDPDLQAILLKALRKEPKERYLTAEQLASDLRAYLEGLPVAARHGTLRYRATKFIRRNRLALAGAALLIATLAAGVAGVIWQARVANEERRKAEARSADLRQLSNSLLSELDEAIQQLPGSTGVQKLLVTRVLEHLDRMAKDAHGDRVTQLDLVDAYSRLGNLQGNSYAQNLGDVPGALQSIGKAIALAEPLGVGGSKDVEALRALALAQMYRSEILFGTPRMQETIASMQASIQTYDRIVALPGATPAEICEAATAYGVLGDELGQGGNQSLNDMPGALAAYRKDLDLVARALSIDPKMMRARRASVIGQLKIAETESEADPAQALKDFRIGLERANALPKEELASLRMVRVRNSLLEGQADVLVSLGEYSSANALYAEVTQTVQHLAAADPQDSRALFDLQTALNQQAASYEAAADPELSATSIDRRGNLAAAQKLLIQEIDVLERMLKQDPSNDECKPVLAGAEVRLATIQSKLHTAADSGALARKGLTALKDLAKSDQASPTILDQAAGAFLKVEPASLRDPQFAVSSAERAVALSHGKTPSILLTLAQAYRATGQLEKSRAIAAEGLALLPALPPGGVKPSIRKLLKVQMATPK